MNILHFVFWPLKSNQISPWTMWVWGYDESAEREGGSLDTTIGIEFEYPERTNGWRTDAHCVFGRPAASCSARWVTGLIVGFGNRRPDVLIQRKFTMWHNSWWWGKCWVNMWNWTFMGYSWTILPSHFCGSKSPSVKESYMYPSIPRKANPLMFAASSGRSRTVDTALKAISELFSKYEDEDQQWEGGTLSWHYHESHFCPV